ncbi:MAG TPA: M64 family metallopeptidase [Thermoanaerobaculia bacterium]|nr:M64 family metallopeptidase [Thermoanaerobaculia bacterium]
MRHVIGSVMFSLLLTCSAFAADPFDAAFRNKTMRVDYFHTNAKGEEILALDEVVSDGPWSGSRTRLVDDTNLGKYLFQVIDPETNRVLYSRGYASLYGEWETVPDSKTSNRTFHESVRFPWPKAAFQLVVKKRDPQNRFHEIWSIAIDPESRFVNPSDRPAAGKVWTILESGPPHERVDLLILSDGYSEKDLPKFHNDAKQLVDALFSTEPFKSRKGSFNVRAIDLATERSGIHRPRTGDNRRTPLGTQYNIFDSERYVLTEDNKSLREIASGAPYEFLEILVNETQYGGGGIFNDHATAVVGSGFANYLFIHEFGHHFAGLADEYYTSDVAYETGAKDFAEPWEPNITALLDPAKLKWRDLVVAGTPLPTPWEKEAFETHSREVQSVRTKIRSENAPESVMDKLFKSQQEWETKFLSSMKHSGRVGAFEGAGYEAKGLYRAESDCIMFTRDEVGFCRVCRRGIDRVIDLYSRP